MFIPDNNYDAKEEFDEHFERYCDWCWGHGFGNCDICKERKLKYAIENFSEV